MNGKPPRCLINRYGICFIEKILTLIRSSGYFKHLFNSTDQLSQVCEHAHRTTTGFNHSNIHESVAIYGGNFHLHVFLLQVFRFISIVFPF